MNLEEYIQKLKTHVEAQSTKLVCDDSESILEMLYDIYAEANSFDNEIIREDFHRLYRCHGKFVVSLIGCCHINAPFIQFWQSVQI